VGSEMEGRSRRRMLSREEIELWAHVTRRDEPLARRRGVNGAKSAAAPLSDVQAAIVAPPVEAFPISASKTAARGKPSSAPAPEPFDPRIGKRIARGARAIDARLDLHGMRQRDAYSVLKHFLARCQAEGRRHVLIITGKGGNSEDADTDFWRSPERGVLRRLVPHWLSEPSLRSYVVSYTESAHKHGGSGALYVTVRKGHRQGRDGGR
jgi:DNA-nicking Smr family endonuclease